MGRLSKPVPGAPPAVTVLLPPLAGLGEKLGRLHDAALALGVPTECQDGGAARRTVTDDRSASAFACHGHREDTIGSEGTCPRPRSEGLAIRGERAQNCRSGDPYA